MNLDYGFGTMTGTTYHVSRGVATKSAFWINLYLTVIDPTGITSELDSSRTLAG